MDSNDFPGVLRAVNDLQKDVFRVTGQTPAISRATNAPGLSGIIIGTIGRNSVIDRMIRDHKLDVSAIEGQWESFLIQVVANPVPGVASALVIAGATSGGPSMALMIFGANWRVAVVLVGGCAGGA